MYDGHTDKRGSNDMNDVSQAVENDTVSWYITFGFGGPHAGQYTEVKVPADLPFPAQSARARGAAFERYGKAWAFDYPAESFERAIKSYGMTLREVIEA